MLGHAFFAASFERRESSVTTGLQDLLLDLSIGGPIAWRMVIVRLALRCLRFDNDPETDVNIPFHERTAILF